MDFVGFSLFYVILLFGSMYAAMAWVKSKRRPKLPFKPEREKLLRGPGESLRRRIEALDEEMVLLTAGLVGAPFFAGLLVLFVLHQGGTLGWSGRLVAAGVTTLMILVPYALFLSKKAIRRGNHYLGWYGERMTAEELDPLREKGWRVFHDVPVDRHGAEWNIDHVAIGAGGVFAIETKMRRKGNVRTGRKDHEVIAMGRQLSWPWGEDDYGLKQAEENAQELRDWLEQLTGIHVEVTGVLTFPGWYVNERVLGPVRVVNASALPALLTARHGVLSDKQIEIIARQFEARCRDVEY